MKPELVIFDFDGVLIDSEVIGSTVWSGELKKAGFDVPASEILENYTGKSGRQICAQIEENHRKKLPHNFLDIVNVVVEEEMGRTLKAVPGAGELLEKLEAERIPVCIASGSRPERLFLCLKVTGLDAYFNEANVFSALLVKHGKPAPDIFLYAADKMGVSPEKCLVIEDSVAGVTAGVSAGMTVYGFTGGSHCAPNHADKLKAAGAHKIISKLEVRS